MKYEIVGIEHAVGDFTPTTGKNANTVQHYDVYVIMNGFNQSFTVYGFTLSFWDIWLWSIIGAIVAAFIGGMLK